MPTPATIFTNGAVPALSQLLLPFLSPVADATLTEVRRVMDMTY